MTNGKEMTLWENEEMELVAGSDPGLSQEEGCHIILLQKKKVASPWADPELYSRMCLRVAQACAVMMAMEPKVTDWFNIQYNGNLGVAAGKPKLHIHIFGRREGSETWGGPVQLPSGEGPHGNKPMSQSDIKRIREALKNRL